jgi:uncharacterized protein
MNPFDISEDVVRGTVTLSIRVQPGASKDEIAGTLDGALKIRLRARPIENRSNNSLIEFLADLLKTSKSAVRIQGGTQSRLKRVEIRGVTRQQILDLLHEEA